MRLGYAIGWTMLVFGAAAFYLALIGTIAASYLFTTGIAERMLQLCTSKRW
jgi:hypothetical protein